MELAIIAGEGQKSEIRKPNLKLVKPEPTLGTPLEHAINTYIQRAFGDDGDMEPEIVQMMVDGQPIDHFYYRSENWIEQPYSIENKGIKPFSGPSNQPLTEQYGQGSFKVDEEKSMHALREFARCYHPEYF